MGSTMDAISEVMRGPKEKRHNGIVVQSLTQSHGRGSGNRQWQSPQGNLYFSMLIEMAGLHSCYLALIAALSVMEAAKVSTYVPHQKLSFKLPNDVMLDGKKVCGILTNDKFTHEGFANVGVGVNVHTTPDVGDARNIPTSFAEYGWPVAASAQRFLSLFLNRFETNRQASIQNPYHAFVALGAMKNDGKGILTVRDDQGEFTGRFSEYVTADTGKEYMIVGGEAFALNALSVRLTNGQWTGRYPYPL